MLVTDKTPYISDDEIWEWMEPIITQNQERNIWWIKIKWLIYNETVNSIIEKILYSLSVLCKLGIRDSERLYFQ